MRRTKGHLEGKHGHCMPPTPLLNGNGQFKLILKLQQRITHIKVLVHLFRIKKRHYSTWDVAIVTIWNNKQWESPLSQTSSGPVRCTALDFMGWHKGIWVLVWHTSGAGVWKSDRITRPITYIWIYTPGSQSASPFALSSPFLLLLLFRTLEWKGQMDREKKVRGGGLGIKWETEWKEEKRRKIISIPEYLFVCVPLRSYPSPLLFHGSSVIPYWYCGWGGVSVPVLLPICNNAIIVLVLFASPGKATST
jgi:hypothetical protein